MQSKFGHARLPGNTMTTLLWGWFAVGTILLVVFPALRQHDQMWGWLPFWCVVAPLIDLAFVQRQQLLAAGNALRGGVSRRRRTRRQRQAVDLRNRGSHWGMRRRARRLQEDQLQR